VLCVLKTLEEIEAVWYEHKELMCLLPILEYPYPDVLKSLSDETPLTSQMQSDVIYYSLKFQSEYWIELSVKWLENGFPLNIEISEALIELSRDKVYSQNLRHRSLKLGVRWKRDYDSLQSEK
jgi:hypothetical protein